MKTKPNEPLSPSYFTTTQIKDGATYGLTKREYFAGRAMQGILASTNGLAVNTEACCRVSVDVADMLIKYLNDKEVK